MPSPPTDAEVDSPIPPAAPPYPAPERSQARSACNLAWWGMLGGLLLLVMGARLWFIHQFAQPTIFQDEWMIEGDLFKRFIDGHLTLNWLASSYKGHRLLFPRLFLLGLFCANGRQWDPLVFMVAQTPLYAMGITFIAGMCGTSMENGDRAALAFFSAAIGVIPFGWENALFGCNVHFPMCALIGLLVVWLCWRFEALSWRWWIGAMLALANLFVMGGGVFATITIAIFLTLGLILEPRRRNRRDIAGICVLLGIVVFGIVMGARKQTQGPSFIQFAHGLAVILAWPELTQWYRFIIIQAPIVLLGLCLLWKRIAISDARWLPVISGSIYWIQAAGTVDQRLEHLHASRYNDAWVLLAIALAASMLTLRTILVRRRAWYAALLVLWGMTFFAGAMENMCYDLPNVLSADQTDRLLAYNSAREYLHTGDRASLGTGLDTGNIDPAAIKAILPPDLANPNPPLAPVSAQYTAADEDRPDGIGEWNFGLPVYQLRTSGSAPSRTGITMHYAVPQGTREVTLLVKGQVDLFVNGYHIHPRMFENELWKPVAVTVRPSQTGFDIRAAAEAMSVMAFTAPSISARHKLGRLARDLAGDCSHNASVCIVWTGLLAMVVTLAAMASIGWKSPPIPTGFSS